MRIFACVLLCSVFLTTTACNTVKGLGRDIQSVGQAGDDVT